ncbi:MAG TPA: glycosyltransferase family 2 protein [Pirellulales bacterium]|nr:glycosyltransferase family 2 protein [Pirellulales bacterium]
MATALAHELDQQPASVGHEQAHASSTRLPGLTVVIPALNEEESIGNTVRRCLNAVPQIMDEGHVRHVEVIVVSDGSTDRTVEIAQELADSEPPVSLIIFPQNKGYGAAIKAGFEQGTGELVAFLDADGTCDPTYFAEMCRVLQEESAAVVLGSRMGERSQMPRIRRIGNRIYAFMLGLLSGRAVDDTASGMRVIRRTALRQLYPLPDGLHFTPAMSARALMTGLDVVEIPMDYAERVGRSKLSVLRDGVRFFRSILEALLLYRPGRFFSLGAIVCLVIGLAWILYPIEFYLRNQRLEEWMIYRVLLASFLFTCSFVLQTAGSVADRLVSLLWKSSAKTFWSHLSDKIISRRCLYGLSAVALVSGTVLVAPGVWEYVTTAHVTTHWSRVVACLFLYQLAITGVITAVQLDIIALWKSQLVARSK